MTVWLVACCCLVIDERMFITFQSVPTKCFDRYREVLGKRSVVKKVTLYLHARPRGGNRSIVLPI